MIGLGLAFAFGVDCGAGAAASSFLVPRANAQQANLAQWDYYRYDGHEIESVEMVTSRAKRLGLEGWEYVGSAGYAVCFKRPLEPGHPPVAPTQHREDEADVFDRPKRYVPHSQRLPQAELDRTARE
jgi:hypothetical protein